MNLFRKQIVSKLRDQNWGEVNISQPIPFKWLFWIFFLFTTCTMTFLVFANVNQTQSVQGIIQYSNVATDQISPIEGIVSDVFVEEGQTVNQGDALFEIKNQRRNSEGELINFQLVKDFQAQLQTLKRTAEAQRNSQKIEAQQLKQQIVALRSKIELQKTKQSIQNERLTVATIKLQAAAKLNGQAMIPHTQFQQAQESLLNVKLALFEANQVMNSLNERLDDLNIQKQKLPFSHEQQRQKSALQQMQTEQQLKQHQAQATSTVYAERTGTLINLLVQAQQRISAGQQLSSISDKNDDVIAYLFLPSTARGFINPGDHTKLKVDAFPFQKFGSFPAVIESISANLVSANMVRNVPAQLSSQSHYQTRTKLVRLPKDSSLQDLPLKPGMTLTADIVIEKRSLIAWLFAPLIGAVR